MSEQNGVGVVPQGDPVDAELGEGGKKALVAERESRKAAERDAAALQARVDELEAASLSELEKAQKAAADADARAADFEAQIKARDVEILRQRVANELKLPAELVDRLRGDDEEAIRADAKSLAAIIPTANGSPRPKPDPFQGGDGTGLHSSINDADRAFVGQLFQKD